MLVDELKEMSVLELRIKAREVGVKAPTTKTSHQLIQEILDIESGKMLPSRSNMGRPPKTARYNKLKDHILESSLYVNNFENITETQGFVLEDDNVPDGITNGEYDCYGIVRNFEDKKFIKNYLCENDYDILEGAHKIEVEQGDLIIGKYKIKKSQSFITEYKKVEFKNDLEDNGKCFVTTCKDISEMYNYISKQDNVKIIVEAEARLKHIPTIKEKEFFIFSKECEDIIKTYNMLLDVKNLIFNLTNKNCTFSVYFVDVEYIYSILSMYYRYKNSEPDINAGQYFKEILCAINNAKGGEITLLEKEQGPRSSYFDIIINKYCKKV